MGNCVALRDEITREGTTVTYVKYSDNIYCSLNEFYIAVENERNRNQLIAASLSDFHSDIVFTRRQAIEVIAQTILIWPYLEAILMFKQGKLLHLIKMDIEQTIGERFELLYLFHVAADDGEGNATKPIRPPPTERERKAAALLAAREIQKIAKWY